MTPHRLKKFIFACSMAMLCLTSGHLLAQNEECSTARLLVAEGTQTVTEIGQLEYWYRFVMPSGAQRNLLITATGSEIQAFSGTCASLVLVGASIPGSGSALVSGVLPGADVFIRFDNELPPTFQLTTSLAGGGGGGGNTAPTDITLSNTTIDENAPGFTIVGNLGTVDANAGDTFTYTLVAGTGSTDNASFEIVTVTGAQLVNFEVFDFETKSSYSIRIRSTDAGGLFFEKQFTITVNDLSEGGTPPPTGNANQSFCNAATVANLAATGTSIKWYDAPTGGTLLNNTTALATGIYYASQTITGVESATRLAVAVTINTTPPPTGNATQTFCNAATIANLTATGTAIQWYSAATGGSPLLGTTSLSNGNYFASQTLNSCESATRLVVAVTINTTAAPTGNATQAFCNSATVANLTATGTAIQWYSAATGGSPLLGATSLSNGNYFASQTLNSCESTTRLAVAVTINTTAAPTGNATQTFCNAATIANLTATGTAIQWYSAATGGSPLAGTTSLSNGNYFASQTLNSCESTARLQVAVTLNTTAAPTGNTTQAFCNSATVANLTATGTAIQWYSAATGGSPLAGTTSLSNGNYFASQTVNGCESLARLAIVVSLNTTAPPSTSDFLQTFCNGATVAQLVATGTAIKWYRDPVGGTPLASTDALSNDYYFASQTVNGCESTQRLLVSVSVNSLDAPTGLANQVFCNTATVANLVATGTSATASIRWYNVTSGGSPLTNTTALTSGTAYYASQAENGCESTGRLQVTATISTTPSAIPIGSATQTFCAGATVFDLKATGNNIKWYTTPTGGTALAGATLLTTGTTYYATQNANGCESASRLASAITTTVNTTVAPTASTPQDFCQASTVADLTATGTGTLVWYSASAGGQALSPTMALAKGTYYVAQSANGCESAPRLAVVVNTAIVDQWKSVAAGFYHSVGIKQEGTLWGWGRNNHGQLGDGTTADKTSPVKIGTDSWLNIQARAFHTMGIKQDRTLWAWGKNETGQLGDGTTADKASPVKIGTDTWLSIAAGPLHTLAIKQDGTLWAWGYNLFGQLGDGTTASKTSPVKIGNDTWLSIATGSYHSLGIKQDGTLWAWGLGDGTNDNKTSPVKIGTDTWRSVTADGNHSLGVKQDGTLWAWGRNNFGQLGDGTTTTTNRNTPLRYGGAPPPPLPAPAITITQPTCEVLTGAITVTSQNPSGTFSFDNGATFQPQNIKSGLASGTYQVITKNRGGCTSAPASAVLLPTATKPTITFTNIANGNQTLTSSANAGNQWFLNGTAIAGATNKTYKIDGQGSYTVQVTVTLPGGPCVSAMSDPFVAIVTGDIAGQASGLQLYPNPTQDKLIVRGISEQATIAVMSITGTTHSLPTEWLGAESGRAVFVASLSSGLYLLRVQHEGNSLYVRFIKQ
ncbi:MAG: T9SS type A sorting domain-containing protein [Cyclobacteriaceae bacterium]